MKKKISSLVLILALSIAYSICNSDGDKIKEINVAEAEHIQGNGGDFIDDIRWYGRQICNDLSYNYPSEFPVQINLEELRKLVGPPTEIIPLNVRPTVDGKEK